MITVKNHPIGVDLHQMGLKNSISGNQVSEEIFHLLTMFPQKCA
jgi:hypothetical protein